MSQRRWPECTVRGPAPGGCAIAAPRGCAVPRQAAAVAASPHRHGRSVAGCSTWLQIVTAVGEVEGLVDQWEVRDDVVDDGVLEHRPVLPGWIVRVAAANAALGSRFDGDEHRPAPALDQADP